MDLMEKQRKRPLVKELNEHIVCPLCRGYLIDATTLECLHSFCRGCILRRLSSGVRVCPVCNTTTRPPLLSDTGLQRLVYLLVPGLFRSEVERRRHFRLVNPQCPAIIPPTGALDLTLDDFVSLRVQEFQENEDENENLNRNQIQKDAISNEKTQVRYLKCPAAVTIRHLIRLLMLKRGWQEANTRKTVKRIEMLSERNKKLAAVDKEMYILENFWTLLDVACIFGWQRDAPMELFYRIVSEKEDCSPIENPVQMDEIINNNINNNNINNKDENLPDQLIEINQRPPTPPPSPKIIPALEPDSDNVSNPNGGIANAPAPAPVPVPASAPAPAPVIASPPPAVAVALVPSALAPPSSQESHRFDLSSEATKSNKKPRCEVTPLMREPTTSNLYFSGKRSKSPTAKLEHHKKRKKRNKRVIAEITTTPREDLLKLKVRLTPCPPRITTTTISNSNSNSNGSSNNNNINNTNNNNNNRHHHHHHAKAKEKLIQMRAVRREKLSQSPRGTENRREKKKADKKDEETIDEIIDSIPDEVVKIAQNIASNNKLVPSTGMKEDLEEVEKEKDKVAEFVAEVEAENNGKKDEEILRRLGLVGINEAKKTIEDKIKVKKDKDNLLLNREKLEKQLRESKANRVRSLLAEKQMRDALKSIMSDSKKSESLLLKSKKGPPPPLAPLRNTGGSSVSPSSKSGAAAPVPGSTSFLAKFEKPLDLSHASSSNGNDESGALDLSSNPGIKVNCFKNNNHGSFAGARFKAGSKSDNGESVVVVSSAGTPKTEDTRKDTNLKTLSDAAVSILTGGNCRSTDKSKLLANGHGNGNSGNSVGSGTGNGGGKARDVNVINVISSNVNGKVTLRIPQPHQRISGFGMKIKPNLGVRHIPNPQAIVAQQYTRNQGSNFLNVGQQIP